MKLKINIVSVFSLLNVLNMNIPNLMDDGTRSILLLNAATKH